jgi:hypothetical protein
MDARWGADASELVVFRPRGERATAGWFITKDTKGTKGMKGPGMRLHPKSIPRHLDCGFAALIKSTAGVDGGIVSFHRSEPVASFVIPSCPS